MDNFHEETILDTSSNEVTFEEQQRALEAEIVGPVQGAPEAQEPAAAIEYENIAAPPPPPPTPDGEALDFSAPPPPPPGPVVHKELPNTVAEAKLRFIITMADTMLAKGYAKIAREMDEQKWRFDEEEIEMLIKAWLPYMKTHGEKIPDWIEVFFVTVWTLGKRGYDAYTTGRTNKANEIAAQSPKVRSAVLQAEAETVERKNFDIDKNGYFTHHPKTSKYIKVADRKEKADLRDIEFLVRDNDLEIIRAAFPNLDTSQYEQND